MGRTFLFSCYVAAYRCAIIIQIMYCAVKVASPLTIFGISKGKFQRLQKSSLYLLGRFQEKYQRAKNNSVQLGQNFQNPLPTKLVGSLKPHFCPNWTEVKKPTSTQVVSKSKKHICATCREVWLQLLHRLCRSWICLKTKKQGTNSLRLAPLLLFDFWCMVNVLL